MAGNTLDLGRVRLVHKGVYSSGTAYEFFDCVTYNGSSYVCTASGGSPAGTLPTDTSKWRSWLKKAIRGLRAQRGLKATKGIPEIRERRRNRGQGRFVCGEGRIGPAERPT